MEVVSKQLIELWKTEKKNIQRVAIIIITV